MIITPITVTPKKHQSTKSIYSLHSTDKAKIKLAVTKFPRAMVSIDLKGETSRKALSIDADQTPVRGAGRATNKKRERSFVLFPFFVLSSFNSFAFSML